MYFKIIGFPQLTHLFGSERSLLEQPKVEFLDGILRSLVVIGLHLEFHFFRLVGRRLRGHHPLSLYA